MRPNGCIVAIHSCEMFFMLTYRDLYVEFSMTEGCSNCLEVFSLVLLLCIALRK
jgi:hypothetical protein